jgi:hypothetical protein
LLSSITMATIHQTHDLHRQGLELIPTLVIKHGFRYQRMVISALISPDSVVKFFDETDDISRTTSAPNIPTASLTRSPAQQTGSQSDSMDYESMFNSFNTGLTPSPFDSNTNQSPFNTNQTSPFQTQTSPPTVSNLGLERLVLNESPPTATFSVPRSQGSRSSPFGHFDTTMANFTSGMPIESMLDVTALGEPSFFHNSNVVTEQTARLMRHYIDNLASWMDLSDSRTHFSTVVPKRALTSVCLSISRLIIADIIECPLMFCSKTSF